MTYLALNLLLAIVWTFLTGSFSFGNLLFGFIVGFLALALAQPFLANRGYVSSTVGLLRFLRVYTTELVFANIQLARDVLRPTLPFKPGLIRYDAGYLSPGERVVLANMISLTPGTLTVDYGDHGRILYIHTVYAQDPEKLRQGMDLFGALIDGVTGHRPKDPSKERAEEEIDTWKHS